jgi:hypothetical protein
VAWQTILLALLTLGATARITRLVTDDTFTQPLRDLINAKAADRWYAADESQPDTLTHHVPAPLAWRWLNKLVTCPWCAGFWISALTALGYLRCWLGVWPWHNAATAFTYPAAVFALSWLVGLAHDWLDSPPPVKQVQLTPVTVTLTDTTPAPGVSSRLGSTRF